MCVIKYFIAFIFGASIILYNTARMSTHSSMGYYLGSRISTDSFLGEYLGYSMYVLFVLTYHIPIQQSGCKTFSDTGLHRLYIFYHLEVHFIEKLTSLCTGEVNTFLTLTHLLKNLCLPYMAVEALIASCLAFSLICPSERVEVVGSFSVSTTLY